MTHLSRDTRGSRFLVFFLLISKSRTPMNCNIFETRVLSSGPWFEVHLQVSVLSGWNLSKPVCVTCELLILQYWFQRSVPRPPDVCVLLWYGVLKKARICPVISELNPWLLAFDWKVHLWTPSFQLQTLCSSWSPAPSDRTVPGCGKSAHRPGCPVRLAARSSPGSCCHKGTPRHWTPCWSRWRSGTRSGCRAPQSAADLSSCGSSGGKCHRFICCGVLVLFFYAIHSLWCFSPEEVIHHIWIGLQQTHQNLILQVRRHLKKIK